MPIVNIAAYQFHPLDQLQHRRESLRALCDQCDLKGTILLSHEGINLFIAGPRDGVDKVLESIRNIPGFEKLPIKESLTDYQPFNRMLVKIKQEIIPVGCPDIDPEPNASPKLPPKELKRWLDEKRPVALLDTRNDYEVSLGTFQGAIDLNLKNFREFPAAAAALPDEVKKQPVVMFCTGGIRCEKIGPYMKGLGFEQIYQLEGGILKYFEECQQANKNTTKALASSSTNAWRWILALLPQISTSASLANMCCRSKSATLRCIRKGSVVPTAIKARRKRP